MRFLRPSLAGCIFLLSGICLYFYLPDQPLPPLWSLDVDEKIGGFTEDGVHFFTFTVSQNFDQVEPIRLREVRTGAQVASFFPDGAELQRPTISKDGRFLAAIVMPDQVRVVDFRERRDWSLAVKDVNESRRLFLGFTPRGDMLNLRVSDERERNFLFEFPSGQLFAKPEEILDVTFAPNGRHLVLLKKDGIHLWDRQARQEVRGDFGDDYHSTFSPDSRRLVTYHEKGKQEPFRLVLWDLETFRRLAVLPIEIPPDRSYVKSTFSPDSRWLVTWPAYPGDGRIMETWDSATGKRLARHDLGTPWRDLVLGGWRELLVGPDSSCVALAEWNHEGSPKAVSLKIIVLDMPSGKLRWQRKLPSQASRVHWQGSNGDFRFIGDGNVLLVFSAGQAEWEFLDIRTGVILNSVRLVDAGRMPWILPGPVTTPDGRRMLTHAMIETDSKWTELIPGRPPESTLTLVLDTSTGDELLKLRIEGIAKSHLAPEGDLVLTNTRWPYHRLQAWPVASRRPWIWIVGIPLGCVAIVLALRCAWRRRGKPVATPASASLKVAEKIQR